MEERKKPGPERNFKTAEDFINKFEEYVAFTLGKERLPNVAGFARYCKINRDTFYNQKEFYPEAFNYIDTILEDEAINGRTNDTFKIFYMKNKFRDIYKDRHEVDNTVNINNGKIDDVLKALK